uniref:Uncharacterized protein n=1 Tax=Caenorhabditis japonica TaxID=281687 RepID=A0A8R1IGT3_CAEJA
MKLKTAKQTTRILQYGTNDVKRFFRWMLGCTYAKKSIKTRITEMFHFAEAPHIIVYERHDGHPWWWTVGVITAVLIGVLSLYYTLESIVRAIRRFFVNALREPQSTVSTPRCLSPVKSTLNNDKISPDILASPPVRQKVAMNEPVNCVFIRPSNLRTPISDSPKISVPKLHSMMSEEDPHEPDSMLVTPEDEPKKKTPQTPQRLEDAQFTAGSNINIRPTLSSPKISTNTTQPSRKSGGIDQEREVSPVPTKSSLSVNEQLEEWMQKQISGVQRLESRSIAGRGSERVAERLEPSDSVDSHVVSSSFMAKIQELIQAQLNLTTIKTESSNENISEMSTVPPSTNPALSVEEISITDTSERSPNEFTKVDARVMRLPATILILAFFLPEVTTNMHDEKE